jgi:hypothetical protein
MEGEEGDEDVVETNHCRIGTMGFVGGFYSINVLSKTHPILGGDAMGAFHIHIQIHIHVHLHLQIHFIQQ